MTRSTTIRSINAHRIVDRRLPEKNLPDHEKYGK